MVYPMILLSFSGIYGNIIWENIIILLYLEWIKWYILSYSDSSLCDGTKMYMKNHNNFYRWKISKRNSIENYVKILV